MVENLPPGVTLKTWIASWISAAVLTLSNKTLANPRVNAEIRDPSGNTLIFFTPQAAAISYIIVTNSSGSSPSIRSGGAGSNVNMNLQPKGTGSIRLLTSNGLPTLQTGNPVTLAVNYVTVNQAATAGSPSLVADGTDTDVDLLLAGKGAGRPKAAAFKLTGGSGTAVVTAGTGSPEGVLSATPGSMYVNTSGGAVTTLYIKESGAGNTGWVAK